MVNKLAFREYNSHFEDDKSSRHEFWGKMNAFSGGIGLHKPNGQ
jgi:hypothetical protein